MNEREKGNANSKNTRKKKETKGKTVRNDEEEVKVGAK